MCKALTRPTYWFALLIVLQEEPVPPVSSGLQNVLKPREVVEQLNQYIVGQPDAKRAVAIALRNRWRRQQLGDDLRNEVFSACLKPMFCLFRLDAIVYSSIVGYSQEYFDDWAHWLWKGKTTRTAFFFLLTPLRQLILDFNYLKLTPPVAHLLSHRRRLPGVLRSYPRHRSLRWRRPSLRRWASTARMSTKSFGTWSRSASP